MKELLILLIQEVESEERSHWYSSGYDVQDEALQALRNVLTNALRRLEEGN